MKKHSPGIFEIVWALIMVAIISSTLTLLLAGRFSGSDNSHWVSDEEYARIERYERLDEVRETLSSEYYRELNEEELILGAIRGMTQSMDDPYTFYYTPEELGAAKENGQGVYHGIGVLVQRNEDGFIKILRVYPDSPALDAGLKAGDVITAVNGFEIDDIDEKSYNEALSRIRGEDGTQVELTVQRSGREWNVLVTRANVSIDFVEYRMLENGIGYIEIVQFSGDSTGKFKEALNYFKAQNARGMIIDVRNNPGGLLTEVLDIADTILPEGVVFYSEDRAGRREDFFSDKDYYNIPLAVLVNDSSASASEVLASAVKVFDRGTVVGMTTYGKGIIQTLKTFDGDGAGIQLTTSRYFAGDGTSIHGEGVTPDIQIAMEGDYLPGNPDPVSDNQLAAAIAVLEEQLAAE